MSKLMDRIDWTSSDLRRKDNTNMVINKLLYSNLKPFFDGLKTINYAVVKGEALSLCAYNDIGWRSSSDIDILVDKKNIGIVESLLENSGFSYRCYDSEGHLRKLTRTERLFYLFSSHQLLPFVKKFHGIQLLCDINFDIFWGEYTGKRINIDEFLSDAKIKCIYGINVKTLTNIKTFIHVILHHYKEMNSLYHLSQKNTIRVKMFQDIYCLLKNTRISPQEVYNISLEYEIAPYVYYMLYYTQQIFQDPFLKDYISLVESDEGKILLNIYGLADGEKKKWDIPFVGRINNGELPKIVNKCMSINDFEKINYLKKMF